MYFATKEFWADAIERGVKTAAQSVAAIGTADGFGWLDAGIQGVAITAGLAFAYTIVTSLALPDGIRAAYRGRHEKPETKG